MTMRWLVDNPYNPDLPVWTRAYVEEMAPGPLTPLSWELFWGGPVVQGWRDAMVDRMGFRVSEIDDRHPELIGSFGGYVYLNASLLRVWSARVPALAPHHIDTAYLSDQVDLPPYVSAPWHRAPEATNETLTRWLTWVLTEHNQSELEAGRLLSLEAAANRPHLARLSDGDLVEHALSLQPLCRVLASVHLNQTLAASIGPSVVSAICADIGLPSNATKLISGLGDIESVAPARVLWTLSRQVRASATLSGYFDAGLSNLHRRLGSSETLEVVGFLAGFDALMSEVGFRGGDDWNLSTRPWRQDPQPVLAAIDRMRACPDQDDPAQGFARRSAERELLVGEITKMLATSANTRDQFAAGVNATRLFIRGRDRGKANVTRVIDEMRAALHELAGRAVDHGDLAEHRNLEMLFADELAYYADGGLADIRSITDERRAHYDELGRFAPPSIVRAAPNPTASRLVRPVAPLARMLETGEVLFGRPGSYGVGRGRARVVSSVAEAAATEAGDILVVSSTSPSWIPFLVGVGGLVLEHGSALSHAVVAARDLDVPAVVAVREATTRIAEGSMVEVDGVTGIVTVLEGLVAVSDPTEPRDLVIDPWSTRSQGAAS
jgi:rifampicin phosphotransferase